MTTTSLKKKIHKYIDITDDSILRIVHTILEEHSKLRLQNPSGLSASDIEELDLRWNDYMKGKSKTYTIEEVKAEVSKRLKAIKH